MFDGVVEFIKFAGWLSILSQNKNHTQIKMKVLLVHVEMHAAWYILLSYDIPYFSAKYQTIYYLVYFTYRHCPEIKIKYSIMYLIF